MTRGESPEQRRRRHLAGFAGSGALEPLLALELNSGANALETQLVELSVLPGSELVLVADPLSSAALAVIWGEPGFPGPGGEISLLDVGWELGATPPASVATYRAPGAGELLLGGRPLDTALVMLGPAAIRVRVPEGRGRFIAECGFDGAALTRPGQTVRCLAYGETQA